MSTTHKIKFTKETLNGSVVYSPGDIIEVDRDRFNHLVHEAKVAEAVREEIVIDVPVEVVEPKPKKKKVAE